MQFDLLFRYDDESKIRPYVLNCDISRVGYYSQLVANLAQVGYIFINIHPSSPELGFHEYTI